MISTKGRYALRLMADLAQREPGKSISLRDVAERQQISVKYLEAVTAPLVRAGLVASRMGKNGGYRLTRAPEEYTVREIILAAEGPLVSVSCLECGEPACPRAGECLTLPLWRELDTLVSGYLESVTLRDLLEGKVKRQ